MESEYQMRSVGTHNGAFHADEVTAVALLLRSNLIDKDKIIRTRDPKKLEQCEYVCDVGGVYDPSKKRFDHHQSSYQGRLSSAGMVLEYLKDQGILKEREAVFFHDHLIMGVDDHDNGVDRKAPGVLTYSEIIAHFVPMSHHESEGVLDKAFMEALDFAYDQLTRMWLKHSYFLSFEEVVKRKMEENKAVLVFDEAIPWMDAFFILGGETHSAVFVIMPSGKHWKLRAIPPSEKDRMGMRLPLPKAWAGLMDGELKKASGIDGAIFCHKGRFFSLWETKEDAMNALKKVLEG